ncbi:MAG TPA: hypothetical protein VFZ96_04945, partial [Actinomycetota bacterium]|nr:hypothetical protein [Actinomycetota bacterium]
MARIFPHPGIVSDVTSDHPDAPDPSPRRGEQRLPTVSADPAPVAGASGIAVAGVEAARAARATPRSWGAIAAKVASGAAALFLFVLALQLMKEGAGELAPS